MKDEKQKSRLVSRRSFLPILGGTLMIPFLGNSKTETASVEEPENSEEFRTLLKSDGTTVRVKTSTLKKAKVVKKNVSNRSLLSWLSNKITDL